MGVGPDRGPLSLGQGPGHYAAIAVPAGMALDRGGDSTHAYWPSGLEQPTCRATQPEKCCGSSDRAFEDQMHRASCLVLVNAAIVAWNTVYLAKALETEQTIQGKTIEPSSWSISRRLARIISICWAAISSPRSDSGRSLSCVRCAPRWRSMRTPATIRTKERKQVFSAGDSTTKVPQGV
jgi:hypothetical protein